MLFVQCRQNLRFLAFFWRIRSKIFMTAHSPFTLRAILVAHGFARFSSDPHNTFSGLSQVYTREIKSVQQWRKQSFWLPFLEVVLLPGTKKNQCYNTIVGISRFFFCHIFSKVQTIWISIYVYLKSSFVKARFSLRAFSSFSATKEYPHTLNALARTDTLFFVGLCPRHFHNILNFIITGGWPDTWNAVVKLIVLGAIPQ